MESFFSFQNNAKYPVPSLPPINPCILSNLLRKGLESIKLLYET